MSLLRLPTMVCIVRVAGVGADCSPMSPGTEYVPLNLNNMCLVFFVLWCSSATSCFNRLDGRPAVTLRRKTVVNYIILGRAASPWNLSELVVTESKQDMTAWRFFFFEGSVLVAVSVHEVFNHNVLREDTGYPL